MPASDTYRCSFDAKANGQDVRIRNPVGSVWRGRVPNGDSGNFFDAMMTFSKLVNRLQRHYGAPTPPPSTDPLELIIWENIAYLASDKRRAEAFAALKRTMGIRPEEILAAQHSALAAIGKAGILPDVSAEKLLTIAKIAYEEFDSDLRAVLKKPLPQAKKALKRFPSIGDPGAEKIFLFTRSYPVMALDSNGLRVLCRVGFAEEQKNYSATYRLAQNAIHAQMPRDYDSLIRAHQLLRQHGQELCKRSKPRCTECPVRNGCNYGRKV
jgi:endonuclease-3